MFYSTYSFCFILPIHIVLVDQYILFYSTNNFCFIRPIHFVLFWLYILFYSTHTFCLYSDIKIFNSFLEVIAYCRPLCEGYNVALLKYLSHLVLRWNTFSLIRSFTKSDVMSCPIKFKCNCENKYRIFSPKSFKFKNAQSREINMSNDCFYAIQI